MTNTELQFDFSYAPGTSIEQIVAFETAGMMWSNYLVDNITVNIHVEISNNLPDNVIGGALPAMESNINYADFRDAYEADITSDRDRESFNSLSLKDEYDLEKFESRIDLGYDTLLRDFSEIDLTRANAKALGLVEKDSSIIDGYILMSDLSSSIVDWSYRPGQYVSQHIDFFSVAVHEIGHVLGFVSGLDKYDAVKFSTAEEAQTYFNKDFTLNDYAQSILDSTTSLDLFRYSEQSLELSQEEGHSIIDLSAGTESYFGSGKLDYQYAMGKGEFGDGFQASHWKERGQLGNMKITGIMDPLMSLGSSRSISDRDLRAIDAIGYDLSYNGSNLVGWADYRGYLQDIGQHSLHSLIPYAKEQLIKEHSSDPYAQGWWVDWLIENMPEYADMYVNIDRTEDVQEIVEQSYLYEGRKKKKKKKKSSYSLEAFWQSAYFSEFSWQEFPEETIIHLEPEAIVVDNGNIALLFDSATNGLAVNPNESIDRHQVEALRSSVVVTTVATDLFSLAETQDSISTVSTEIETELVTPASLPEEQLAESDLVMPLS